MKLTPLARGFIVLVSLLVIGYVGYYWTVERGGPPAPATQTVPTAAPAQPFSGAQAPEPASPPVVEVPAPVAAAVPPSSGAAAQTRTTRVGNVEVEQVLIPPLASPGASVATFYLDRTEVTVQQFMAFASARGGQRLPPQLQDGGYLRVQASHPVTGVSWSQASAFCQWAGKRLPSGAEWEHAARGEDGRKLPWGSDVAEDRAVINRNGRDFGSRAPFGIPTESTTSGTYARDASPFGILGMAGNVSEWTSDDAGDGQKMVRGGSWGSYNLLEAFADQKTPTRADLASSRIGLRCAADANAPMANSPGRTGDGDSLLERIRSTGLLRVGAEPETPPMLTGAPPGPYNGFDYEVAQAVASHFNAQLKIVPGRYADLPGALARGDFDLIISGYTPDPSIKGVDWSSPYMDFGLALIVASNSGIERVRDLAGKRVGIFNDPAAERAAQQLVPQAASIARFEDHYLESLVNGQLDGFLYDFPYAQAEVARFGGGVRIAEYNLTRQSYAIGAPAGATNLVAEVNTVISRLRTSPQYKRMVRSWLGRGSTVAVRRGAKVYRVKAGDSLSAIAQRQLGNVNAWPRIWDANRHRIGNPDLIDVGMDLEMP